MGRFWKKLLLWTLIWGLVYSAALAGIVLYFGRDLPSLEQLERFRPKLATLIYDSEGKVVKELAEERRVTVPFDQIPEEFFDALLAVEDREFYHHNGVNFLAIVRAALANISAGRIVEGASTVTQQLARNLFLSFKVSLSRKIREALTAIRIERAYTKEEILEMYANQVYFGRGAWGIQAAARTYFDKDAEDLTLEECALLVWLLRSPNRYPALLQLNPEVALRRRNIVLDKMVDFGAISRERAEEAKARPLGLHTASGKVGEAPYFVEYVRQYLMEKYGSDMVYKGGLRVYTTLNTTLQGLAEKFLLEQLAKLQAESPYPDSIPVQGALVALETHTGHILAMVGGRDFKESQFNRAVQALRQPGSAFKPIIYAAAVDNGWRTIDTLLDVPITLPMPDGTVWRPENYDHTFLGPITLREAIKKSRNLATIRLLMDIQPQTVIPYARQMGITSPLRPVYSMALGTNEVTLLELTAAYCTFPNGGVWVEPTAVLRVEDREGRTLEEREHGEEREALSPETAAVMVSLLESVMEPGGTGYGARKWYGFKRPAGGKTGTTGNFADAWFVGFTPQIACGVWVGYDQKLSLGPRKAGAAVALPVWARFMKAAHDTLGLPVVDFRMPPTVVQLDLCAETMKIATPYCPKVVHEVFKPGTEPTETCDLHRPGTGRRPAPSRRGKIEF